MKKIAIIVAILALTAPAMAAPVDINAVPIGTTGDVNITYISDANLSGFALDITVDSGASITAISNFHTGESIASSKGFGIFPGRIDINSVTGLVDDHGNPVAPGLDPCALGDIPGSGITIELGALYEDGNAPGLFGTLCTLTVDADCNITVALNARRGGVVREDFGDATTNLPITRYVTIVSFCTVPNILDMNQADANQAILDAGLLIGDITYDSSCTAAIGTIMSQDPCEGEQLPCNPGHVNSVQSMGCYPWADPNYQTWLDVNEPNCWCYPRQCHADTDDTQEGDTKTGYFYVWSGDLNQLIAGWKQPYSGDPSLDGPDPGSDPDTWICADFAHNTEGDTKTGYFRVWSSDLNILIANWKSNPAANCAANCPK